MRLPKSYHLYAAITVTLWSLSYVFTRVALRCLSPFALGFARYFLASCALAIALLWTRAKRPNRRALLPLLASGATGFFLYMLAFNTGSQTVTAATSCTVIATTPLITMLLARLVYREKLTALQYAAACVSFVGVVVLTVWSVRLSAGTGLVYIFAAAILLSVYNLLQRRLIALCSPLQSVAYSIFLGTLLLSVFAAEALGEMRSASAACVACVVVLGVLCGAVAYGCWTKALSLATNTASVSNYMFVEPFLTAVFGLMIADEKLAPSTLVGGGIILAGMFLFYFGERLTGRRRAASS